MLYISAWVLEMLYVSLPHQNRHVKFHLPVHVLVRTHTHARTHTHIHTHKKKKLSGTRQNEVHRDFTSCLGQHGQCFDHVDDLWLSLAAVHLSLLPPHPALKRNKPSSKRHTQSIFIFSSRALLSKDMRTCSSV